MKRCFQLCRNIIGDWFGEVEPAYFGSEGMIEGSHAEVLDKARHIGL